MDGSVESVAGLHMICRQVRIRQGRVATDLPQEDIGQSQLPQELTLTLACPHDFGCKNEGLSDGEWRDYRQKKEVRDTVLQLLRLGFHSRGGSVIPPHQRGWWPSLRGSSAINLTFQIAAAKTVTLFAPVSRYRVGP